MQTVSILFKPLPGGFALVPQVESVLRPTEGLKRFQVHSSQVMLMPCYDLGYWSYVALSGLGFNQKKAIL